MNPVTNSYERRARLTPGLLAVVPVGIAAIALGVEYSSVLSAMIGLLVTAGAPVLLMDYVRSRGLLIQKELFEVWGGAPTTQLLRVNHRHSSAARHDHWRDRLETRAAVELPTAEEESADPTAADERYEIATTWAREHTRQNSVVLEENRSYGFHRNLLGMRLVGISVSALSSAITGASMLVVEPSPALLIGAAINLATLVFWFLYPSDSRVEEAAFRYAARLFDAATS